MIFFFTFAIIIFFLRSCFSSKFCFDIFILCLFVCLFLFFVFLLIQCEEWTAKAEIIHLADICSSYSFVHKQTNKQTNKLDWCTGKFERNTTSCQYSTVYIHTSVIVEITKLKSVLFPNYYHYALWFCCVCSLSFKTFN